MYGGPGGDPSVACLMFNRAVGVVDFEVVPEAERAKWTDDRAADILCPVGNTTSS